MGVTNAGHLDLATFDGDVTLWVIRLFGMVFQTNLDISYDDGKSLEPSNPVIQRIICEYILDSDQGTTLNVGLTDLMSQNTKIGIVTAAGYTQAERYYERLHGLLEAIKESNSLTPSQKQNLIVMGNLHLSFDSS
jgi:IMP and pyridine-specific 5'-nucleotidase